LSVFGAMDVEGTVIDKIDRGLAAYYQSQGFTYYTGNVGKFKAYCKKHDFDDEIVDEDLDDFARRSSLVYFDKRMAPVRQSVYDQHESRLLIAGYFRLHCTDIICIPRDVTQMAAKWLYLPQPMHPEDRWKIYRKVFWILRCIRERGHCRPPLDTLDVSRDRDNEQTVLKMYRLQCPLWLSNILNNCTYESEYILSLIALREFNDGLSVFTRFIDCYTRWRVMGFKDYHSQDVDLSVAEWCRSTEYIQRYTAQRYSEYSPIADLHHALRHERIINPKPLIKIFDSLLVIARYLSSISQFIKSMPRSNYPFQCDVCFGVEVRVAARRADSEVYNATDYIGDLHDKLLHNDLRFVRKAVPDGLLTAEQYITNPAFAESNECRHLARNIAICDADFVRFYNEMHPQRAIVSDDDKEHTDGDRITQLMEEAFAEFKQKIPAGDREAYPLRRRFCIFVECCAPNRDIDAQSMDGDEITIFEPPSDCDSLPKGCVEEYFQETARRCIIPHRGYSEELKEENDLRIPNFLKDFLDEETITSQSWMMGTMLTFSFQAMSRRQIVCRVYWNGQTQRFLATDIGDVLPFLFDMNELDSRAENAPQPSEDVVERTQQPVPYRHENDHGMKRLQRDRMLAEQTLRNERQLLRMFNDSDESEETAMPAQSSTSREDDRGTRAKWKVGSKCWIFSRSSKKWFDANITNIFFVGDRNQRRNEWLVVRYDQGKRTKKIQRSCPDIKPITDDDVCSLKAGSKCLILSTELDVWVCGRVLSVFEDEEGEWLKVKYIEDNIWKVCDIQRYSKQLRVYREE